MLTLTSNTSFTEGVDTSVIGSSAPAGNIGLKRILVKLDSLFTLQQNILFG